MNFIQNTLQAVEIGKAQIVVRLIPLLAALLIVGGAYDVMIFHGLKDAQSMDNAQLARQIVRGQGFTTEFLRPQALAQLRDFAAKRGLQTGARDLFPADQFPPGTPRVIPDTYNAPGYPCLLATWFFFTHPEFNELAAAMSGGRPYSGDRFIPLLNQVFLLLTAVLVFILGRRLFDERVAWISLIAFLGTDMVWQFSLTALSTTLLMFLITAMFFCILEVFCVGEDCFNNDDNPFGPAWFWALCAAGLLGVACLTRLHLLVLLAPLMLFLLVMPRGSFLLFAAVALVVLGVVTPWFLHVYSVSGNPLGSNFVMVLSGEGEYKDNQIYCTTSIPGYEHLFGYALKKEVTGFQWHFDHGWNLLGSNPLIFLFAASLLHRFKRQRTRLFHWLLILSAIFIIAANNLGSATPETVGPWNTLAVLFPGMIVIGAAFFFILLDRLNVQIKLLHNLIITAMVATVLIPLTVTLTTPSSSYYAFPPYMPPLIKSLGQYAQPDEWVTSDMPWATAWYSDRPSLWLPDSLADFQNFYDNVCPTGILILTPVSWSQPLSTYTTGEYKEWNAFATGQPLPAAFPLTAHTATAPGGPDYSVWSDRPRWQQH